MREEYSPYKVIHHREELDLLRDGKQIVPKQVQLIISDTCQLSCSFCAYKNPEYTSGKNFGEIKADGTISRNPSRKIPYEKCIEILDDCAQMGVAAIEFTGGGSPTTHPKHREIMQYALDKGLEVSLVSNGISMLEGFPEILAQLLWVRFSIDAGNREGYAKTKGQDRFEQVKENIRKVVAAKKRADSDVVIGVGFVVDKHNYGKIYEGAKLAKELGVDNFRVSAAFMPDNLKYHLEHYQEAKELSARAKKDFQDKDFTVFNLFGDRVQDLADESPEYKECRYMQFTTYIGGDLKVYCCCNNAYNDVGEMGDLTNQSFKEFWFSEAKEKRYENFDARQCERCTFNNKNKFINYCLLENPKHINFV